jgi:2'-5' RNA ligase|nr:RNA 2',3'-cyclic phosphodiesterase [uncultured Lachnoclostridium sp.]
MRIFIAINLTEELKVKLYEQITELKQQSVKGNFTRKENLHLTLAFLGEVGENQLKKLNNVIEQFEFSKFTIEFSNMSSFRNGDEFLPWIGIVANANLHQLHDQLIKELKAAGFTPDDKEFTPHITLGRKVILKSNSERNINGRLIGKEMMVSTISIMKSDRSSGILTYTEIYRRNLS